MAIVRNVIYNGSSSLPTDVENALLGSNSPSATNPFATMDDIGGGGGGGIQSVVAGDNINVDNTDPLNPIVSTSVPKELILYVAQSGTDAPYFTIKENTSDIPNGDITSDIILDLPYVLRPRIILGTTPILFADIKEISFTSIAEKFSVENQTIQSVSINEFADNAIVFNSTSQDILNNTLTNQGGILAGFLTIKFI